MPKLMLMCINMGPSSLSRAKCLLEWPSWDQNHSEPLYVLFFLMPLPLKMLCTPLLDHIEQKEQSLFFLFHLSDLISAFS